MRQWVAVAIAVMSSAASLSETAAPMPRVSPEFVIAAPGRTTLSLSSLRGKVVVIEFMFMRSAHCRRVAQTLNKLGGELGAQGFQPVAVVFDPPGARESDEQLVPFMQQYLQLGFPVGHASKADVDDYLGRARDQVMTIPQLVVIDRAGRIRASSGAVGANPLLEDESALRALIGTLLEEATPKS